MNETSAGQDAESRRLAADRQRQQNWKRWGPYLAERQWGTVREDYSAGGDCWNYFPHDHARSRAYRWGEDGLLGFTDRECRLCFAVALWNGRDPILKERLFGLTGPEGNHGEDVKECYYYLDSTPTHSYCKALYKYPQAAFPYDQLVTENRRCSRLEPEFELPDTGVFADGRYFDVFAEYAKDGPDDLWIRLTLANRGPEAAPLHVLPTLWFRNNWSWGCRHEAATRKPWLRQSSDHEILCDHEALGQFHWQLGHGPDGTLPTLLFTENETNAARIFGTPAVPGYFKDAFDEYVVKGNREAVNPQATGTKAAAQYALTLPAHSEVVLYLRLCSAADCGRSVFPVDGERVCRERLHDADVFHALHSSDRLSPEEDRIVRQARAGVLWSKQFYHYIVDDWLNGDAVKPPPGRASGRNNDWHHVYSRDVLSMPDKWEYPWFAAWDLAFHMVPLARLDPHFAQHQMLLLLREWYMHPSGQLPAYEFNFSDVNPPVHAWACWQVYELSGRDHTFLARVFHKLLLNFTWWVNRKDVKGKHLFAGGFLGLDNIGVFDRSRPLPSGVHLEQADGTAWMAFYCMFLLAMALELARRDASYEDVASKFFEHFVAIADAMNALGGVGLWDEQDGFYYDQLHIDGKTVPLRIRSLVGLIPLIAAGVMEDSFLKGLTGFNRRLQWFLDNRPDLAHHLCFRETRCEDGGTHHHRLLAIPPRERLERVLKYMLDENEFLSPYGLRSLSRYHLDHPYTLWAEGQEHRVAYTPGESDTSMFGGNSNWRGPVWFPINFLLIESLFRYHHFYGDDLQVECPTGSGVKMNLAEVARELRHRLCKLFLPDEQGRRPCHGDDEPHATDPHWRELVLFHEYFHGDSGKGLGASHQTGWTALIASLLIGDVAIRTRCQTGEEVLVVR